MEKFIAQINPSAKIIFDKGKFDNWCVFIIENGRKYAPKDLDYFADIQAIAKEYPDYKVYKDFLKFYKHTTAEINPVILDLIKEITISYKKEHQFAILKWYTVIYAGMIAEENKEKAILKKRIKHLGMYQLLVENKSAAFASGFSKGKKWQYLDEIMKKLGI